MAYASFMGLLKTVLIILLVYFGLKIIFKWLKPFLLKYILNKVNQKMQDQFKQQADFNRPQQAKKENLEKSEKKVGEYIDYEEID
ncbi:DUF4834 domain-containing protein [uncultured Mesonia sp.]|uniref:DUF4834 domain-containing protein n=1 Tax=uncultured Mesonia sp. TaxID=399731 RepID=UPI00374EE413